MSRVLAALLLLAASMAVPAQDAPRKPTRILFIGNSLTSTSDIPGRVASLAREMGRPAEAERVTFNGYSLADHWEDGRALAAIRKGWDIVVLQQGTSARREARAELVDAAKRFAGPIREAGARPAIYMVWPLSDRQYEFAEAIASHRAAAEAIDAIMLPVGEAWLRALSKDKRLRLYGDAIHQSSLGSDLTVLTIYLALFPAGPQEFDETFVARIARHLEMQPGLRDAFFDAATLAIDQPLRVK